MDALPISLYQHAISIHFPDFPIQSITFFKEGWGNRLYLVNGNLIFRFPVDQYNEQLLSGEIRLLPVLAPELPLPIPNYQYIAPSSQAYPYTFAGYPLIPGESYHRAPEELRQATWWRPAVGDFLTALHRIPIQKALAVGLQGYLTAQAWRDALAQKHEPYEQHVFPLLTPAQRQSIRQYLHKTICDERMLTFSPVIIHQDFDFHNFLVDVKTQQVTGVVDFGICTIGDPLIDLSPEISPYYHGKMDPGWDFRQDYYLHTSALEDLLAICTSAHRIPNEEELRNRKLLQISKIYSS